VYSQEPAAANRPGHTPVFLGNVKLNEVQKTLNSQGIEVWARVCHITADVTILRSIVWAVNRISDIIRAALSQASFCGGILVCARGAVNIIKVWLVETGFIARTFFHVCAVIAGCPRQMPNDKIVVNGALCDEYFKIRSFLYSHFQIV